MTDEQDRAEGLDDGVLADEQPSASGDDRFVEYPALDEEYPPEEPLGVEDPGRFEIEDDVARREERRA